MGVDVKVLEEAARRHWRLGLLLVIFLIAFIIRLPTADMKYIQAFDPFFMYRYTEDVIQQGLLPEWDGLSYYPPGRPVNVPPLMFYVTGYLYVLYTAFVPVTLFVFVKYMTAFYGALTVIPAYLLGREFSGKEAGLMAALFVGINPSILSRTMAGFYDTDTMVVFFSLFTMYLFARLLKRVRLTDLREKKKEAWRELAVTTAGVALFALTWGPGAYVSVIVVVSLFVYLSITLAAKKGGGKGKIFREELIERLPPPVIAMSVGFTLVQLLGYAAWQQLQFLFTFAQDPSRVLIVNISVAELQKVSLFSGDMHELFARISVPIVLTLAGAVLLLRRDRLMGSLLLTWSVLSLLSIIQGIRFLLVFAPAAAVSAGVALGELHRNSGRLGQYAFPLSLVFLAATIIGLFNPLFSIVLLTNVAILVTVQNRVVALLSSLTAAAILGIYMSPVVFNGVDVKSLVAMVYAFAVGGASFLLKGLTQEREVQDNLPRGLAIGTMVIAAFITLSQGAQLALASGGESIDANWEEALTWLRDHTSADAVVGTWWDPGHQLTGFSGKRVIADGAHCADDSCSPGLNTRITHLGFIFTTSDEKKAVETLLRYRGDASEMYWIVSDDLIGKFQWLQYFGTGCDGSGNINPQDREKCPLYQEARVLRGLPDIETLQIVEYQYQGGMRLRFQDGVPVVLYGEGEDVVTFRSQVAYLNKTFVRMTITTGANRTIPATVWIHPDYAYLVIIPPTLENAMFTRMFFYEDEFEHFELVFKNSAIKIYKLRAETLNAAQAS